METQTASTPKRKPAIPKRTPTSIIITADLHPEGWRITANSARGEPIHRTEQASTRIGRAMDLIAKELAG